MVMMATVSSALQLPQLLQRQPIVIFDIDASKILIFNETYKIPSFFVSNDYM